MRMRIFAERALLGANGNKYGRSDMAFVRCMCHKPSRRPASAAANSSIRRLCTCGERHRGASALNARRSIGAAGHARSSSSLWRTATVA